METFSVRGPWIGGSGGLICGTELEEPAGDGGIKHGCLGAGALESASDFSERRGGDLHNRILVGRAVLFFRWGRDRSQLDLPGELPVEIGE